MDSEKQMESMNTDELNELYEQVWLENEAMFRDHGVDSPLLKDVLKYIDHQLMQRL